MQQGMSDPAPAKSWTRDYLPVLKPTLAHARARLSSLPRGDTGNIIEIIDENENELLEVLIKERTKLLNWAAGVVKVEMVKMAQLHGVEYDGQLVKSSKNFAKAWAADSSERMQECVYMVSYGAFPHLHGVLWEEKMEKKYMEENNLRYAASPGAEAKGCIAQIINKRLNELRVPIRTAGENTHGIVIKVRDDPIVKLEESTPQQKRKRKNKRSSCFDATKHVRKKGLLAGNSNGTVEGGKETITEMISMPKVGHNSLVFHGIHSLLLAQLFPIFAL
jgi:hypothetical protein